MRTSDAELLRRIASARDAESFAEFYDRFAARVYGLLLTLLRNRTDADDVLQQTFLQIWTQAERFDPARSIPEGWALMLARSRALDRLRKRPTTSDAALPEMGTAEDPSSNLQRDETVGAVRQGLALLPRDQRQVIALAFFEGFTHEQIAAALELPLGTVKTRIRLGIIRLRDRFRDQETGSENPS